MKKTILSLVLLALFTVSITSCRENESKAEDAIEDVADDVEDAADEIED